ncbi:MAG TPA: hypothetical protein VE781_09780, partial [Kineosporiaceae bacterium]|nr:hypothetical protein [Kineosporiaceae bacterium]
MAGATPAVSGPVPGEGRASRDGDPTLERPPRPPGRPTRRQDPLALPRQVDDEVVDLVLGRYVDAAG